jgi:hypothetical protein
MTSGQRATSSESRRRATSEMTSRNRINAGIGGVGGGTGLVAIGQQIGPHTVLGQVVIYVAPAVSVILGAAIYQLKQWADWYNEKAIVRRARKTLEGQLKNSHTSDEFKVKIRAMLEDLDHAVAEAEVARVKSLKRN